MYIHPGFKFDTEERGLSWRLICDGECRKSCKGDVPVTVLAVGERYDQLLYKLRYLYWNEYVGVLTLNDCFLCEWLVKSI